MSNADKRENRIRVEVEANARQPRNKLRSAFACLRILRNFSPSSSLLQNFFCGSAMVLFGLCLGSGKVLAYETSTHSILTDGAYDRSLPGRSPTTIEDFGLNNPQAIIYSSIGKEGIRYLQTAKTVMMRGSVYEDDFYEAIAFNHFFDPQYNSRIGVGLYLKFALKGIASPDWVLEDSGAPALDKNSPTGAHSYTYRNAQLNFYSALTRPSPSDRLAAQNLMWQSLGHTVHHVQDMAQPQHVRNEPHIHFPIWWGLANFEIPLGISAYEMYTQSRNDVVDSIAKRIYSNGTMYPIPSLGTVREFFHTKGSTPRYVGMAEFTSQNFVTPYTAFSSPNMPLIPGYGYPLPDSTGKKFHQIEEIKSIYGISYSGKTTYVVGAVTDGWSSVGNVSNVKLARSSFLNLLDPLSQANFLSNRPLAMDYNVFDEQHQILLPRAQAFSAGVIDHFFRGRLFIMRSQDAKTWTITNPTTLPMNGELALYGETNDGYRSEIPNSRVTRAIGAHQKTEIVLNEAPNNIVKIVAVFRGQIGQEGDPTLASTFYSVAGVASRYTPPTVSCPAGQVLENDVCVTPQPPQPPQPPAACRGPFTLFGRNEYVLDVGGTAGLIQVNGRTSFGCHTPHMRIYANNAAQTVIGGTSLVGWDLFCTISLPFTTSFNFNPVALGTTQIRVKIESDSSSPPTADQLKFAVSCPGGTAPDLTTVKVGFGTDPERTCGVSCETLPICGAYSVTIDGQPRTLKDYFPQLKIGQHTFVVSHTGMSSGACENPPSTRFKSPGQFWYSDNNGKHYLKLGSNTINVQ